MIKRVYNIFAKEGLFNFIKRKSGQKKDTKVHTLIYENIATKIVLNDRFGYVDRIISEEGVYEKDIIDDIRLVLNKDKNLIDIDANIGQHSLLLAPFCKNVYSFEPIPEVYTQFKKSIELNKIQNINLYNAAISDKVETKTFNYVKFHAGTSSFVERSNKNIDVISVQTETLESVLKDVKMDVIKLDVEGYELVVILGNKEKILKDKPIIFMEFSPDWIQLDGSYTTKDAFDFFAENNFEIFSRNKNKTILYENVDLSEQDNWVIKPKN